MELSDFESCLKAGNEPKLSEVASSITQQTYDKGLLRQFASLSISYSQYSLAISFFKAIESTSKLSAEDYFGLAMCCFQLEDWENSANYFKLVLQQNPKHLSSIMNLALCFEHQKLNSKAIELYQQALVIERKNPDIYNNYANNYQKQRMFEEAEAQYQRGLKYAPNHYLLLKNYLLLLIESGNYTNFESIHGSFASLYQSDSEPDYIKAVFLQEKGLLKQAIDYFERSLTIFERSHKCWVKYISCLVQDEQIDKAIQKSRKRYSLANDSASLYLLAYALSYSRKDSDLNEARLALINITAQNNLNFVAMDCLVKVYLKLGLNVEAIAACNAIYESCNDLEILSSLQASYVTLNKLEKAQEVLTLLVQKQPDCSEHYRDLGILYIKQGNLQSAEEFLSRAFSLCPNDQRTLAHYIIVKQGLGKTTEAASMLLLEHLLLQRKIEVPGDVSHFLASLKKEIMLQPTLEWEPKGLATRKGQMTQDIRTDEYLNLKLFKESLHKIIDDYIALLKSLRSNVDIFMEIPESYKVHLWAVVLDNDGYVGPHIHENSWLSGAFYVQLPNVIDNNSENKDGYLLFGMPHENLNLNNSENYKFIQPREGYFVIFPSYYFHSTIPYSSKKNRISLAFDVEILD